MILSPLCLVQDGAGPFVPTLNGVDVSLGDTISIKLFNTSGVVDWFLEVIGTDELSTVPALTNVNPITHKVLSPTTVVTFTFPGATGRAIGFKSTVTGAIGPFETTFGIYSLTAFTTRVGFVTETREGDTNFGWSTKLNPIIRSGGGGGGAGGYSLTEVTDAKTIPEQQSMVYEESVLLEDDGVLNVEGIVSPTRTEDNFSINFLPTRSTRVIQENDLMLYTDSIQVDGNLVVDGDILDGTPYTGDDIITALNTLPGQKIIDKSITTVTNTATTIYSYTTTRNNRVIAFDLLIEAQSNANTDVALFKISAVCHRATGFSTVTVKDIDFLNGPYRDAGAAAWNVTFAVPGGGPIINIQVAGDLGESIDWRLTGRVVEHG